jgi:hypothetical protein
VLGSSAAAIAQTQPAATAPPDAEVAAARDRLRANIAAMGSQNVPMAVEPAFQFKA